MRGRVRSTAAEPILNRASDCPRVTGRRTSIAIPELFLGLLALAVAAVWIAHIFAEHDPRREAHQRHDHHHRLGPEADQLEPRAVVV